MQINKRQEGRNNKIDRKTKTNTSLLTIMTDIKKKATKKIGGNEGKKTNK